MLPEQPCFIFYIESLLLKDGGAAPEALNFIKKLNIQDCYYFTHNCDISRHEFYNQLIQKNIPCKYSNVITPNYLLINYYKEIYGNFSAHSVSLSKDFHDFIDLEIQVDHTEPRFIIISSKEIREEDLSLISNSKAYISFSSNICSHRSLNCNTCKNHCIIKNIRERFKDRILIPDAPTIYNSYNVFKQLSIQPKRCVVFTHILRDDYAQFQRSGCKLILILNNGTTFESYIKSPYDSDLVVDNFKNLSLFMHK